MLQHFLKDALEILNRYKLERGAASEILNALHGAALKVFHVGRIVVAGPGQVVLTIHGERTRAGPAQGPGFWLARNFVELNLKDLNLETGARDLERALGEYRFSGDGAYVWVVPDGYLAPLTDLEKRWEREGGGYFSHEAVCVQNTGAVPTRCELEVCFEARAGEIETRAGMAQRRGGVGGVNERRAETLARECGDHAPEVAELPSGDGTGPLLEKLGRFAARL